MEPNNNIQKKILGKLDQHRPIADYNSLWETLEPRLEKKKRRRVLIWLFFGIGMITVPALLFILTKDSNVKIIKVPSVSNSGPSISSKAINPLALTTRHTVINNNDPKNTFTQKSNLSNDKSNLIEDSKNMDLVSSNTKGNQKSKIHVSSDRPDFKMETLDSNAMDNQNTVVAFSAKIYEKTKYENISNEDTLRIVTKSDTILASLYIPYLDHQTPFIVYENKLRIPEKIDPINEKKWTLSGSVMVNYSSHNLQRSDETSTLLKTMITAIPGYSLDLNMQYAFHKKWFLTAGIHWATYFEKFLYLKDVTLHDEFENPQAFVVEGNYISATQKYSKTFSYDILHYNKQNLGSIQLGIHHRFTKNWYSELLMRYVILPSYSGRLLDEKQLLVREGPIFDQSKVSSFAPSVIIGYQFSNVRMSKPSVFFGYTRYKYRDNPLSPFSNAIRQGIEMGCKFEMY
jgi:hypothetical protein